ncbi:MAG: hypothetical protein ACYC8T_13485 [Myxococcaceae bacterium]
MNPRHSTPLRDARGARVLCARLLCLALTAGCAGPDLRKEKVAAVEPQFLGAPVCPGQRGDLIVTVMLENGKRLVSEGKGHGDVAWSNFVVRSDVATLARRGEVVFAEDPRAYGAGVPVLRVETAGHPNRNTQVEVPVRFDCDYLADFSGRDGANGSHGADGHDPTAEQAATAGEPGGDGTPGGSSEPVRLTVAVVRTDEGVAYLQVQALGLQSRREHLYLIDTRGGRLTVSARGGAGGSGGHGGEAGAGKGVAAGGGGSGANGGNGGDIEVVMSDEAAPFEKLIRYELSGGAGGAAGENKVGHGVLHFIAAVVLTPVAGTAGKDGTLTFRREPVPPLW